MPNAPIHIQYNEDLKDLTQLLSTVKRPGEFYATGSLEAPIPYLRIDGIGTISFPLPENQAKTIIDHAELAPYGKGEETILDTKVRKVWQISPDKIKLSGKSWKNTFETILARVTQDLGCEKIPVSAELYKLLL